MTGPRELSPDAAQDEEITPLQLRQMLQLQRALLDVAAGARPARQRIDEACRCFEAAVPGSVASVMLLDTDGLLQVLSAPSIPPEIAARLNDLTPGPGAGSCGNVIYRQEPVFVSDTLSDPRWADLRPLALDHQLKACWSMPLRDRNQRIVGTFALTSFAHGLPHAFERQLLELGASTIALLLQQRDEEAERDAREEHLRRLALVASHASNGVIIMDAEGVVVWVNEAIQRMSGYSADELLGRHPGDVLDGPRTDPRTSQRIRDAMRAQQPVEVRTVNHTKSGIAYWVHKACSPIRRADGSLEGFISVETDITALRRLADFNALHAAVNQVVASSDDVTAFLQSICELAVRHAGLKLAFVARPDESGRFRFLASAGDAVGYLDDLLISANPDVPEGQGSTGKTWREGRPFYNQSFAATAFLSPWHARARQFGLDASATQPIVRSGGTWAVLTVYHEQRDIFDAELCALLEALAHDISRGLDRIDLLQRERQLAQAQKQLSEQLHQEKELAQITLASVGDAVMTADVAGHVTFLNPIAELLTGWSLHQAVGRRVTDVFHIVNESSRRQVVNPVDLVLRNGRTVNLANHTVLIARSGAEYHIEDSAAPIFAQDGTLHGCVLVFRDITEKYEAQRRLQWQATHDPLTSLPNRYALEMRLRSAIDRAHHNGTWVALGLLDLDDFKPINDTHGHAVGDLLLQELARRLGAQLRDGDLLARLGGDELVVMFDNIPPDTWFESLEAALVRLHRAVETPFDVGPAMQIELGMSMGIALYPRDAEDGDGLLRQADAAMYASKSSKFTRSSWWHLANAALPSQGGDTPINPYGDIAANLLRKADGHWEQLGGDLVESFYAGLRSRSGAAAILGMLTADELARLKASQDTHLRRLLAPQLTRDEHDAIALHIGRVHALIGVESSDVMAAMNDYGSLLHQASQRLPWRMDVRLALHTILQARLARELQIQSRGRDDIEQGRLAHLAQLEAQMHDWIRSGDFPQQLADHLARLSHLRGVAIGRPDSSDVYVLEFAAGCVGSYLDELRGRSAAFDPAPSGLRAQGPTWRAWRTGQIQLCDSELLETESEAAVAAAAHNGIRSSAAIPILDPHGHPMIVISLLGAYPAQFGSPPMRMWLESVQHLVTPVFQRLEKGVSSAPIDAVTRQHLHALLSGDHLQIVVQPVVRLETGAIEKVEMLARLRDGERLLSPGEFLPAFGQQDLQVLFRKGLRQILRSLASWDEQGLHLDASINLPPSVLVARDCPRWVEDELAAAGLAPNRLYLELLETEDDALDTQRRDAAITQLATLGVRLVMDDLGSGYSSLQRLRTLPFHTVKIDQELVKHAPADPEQTVPFIGSLIRMARGLGLRVVVEGLETDALVEMAVGLGADYGQGYALARPMLPEALADWIAQRQWPFGANPPTSDLGVRARRAAN